MQWTTLQPLFTHADLGLPANAEIDALALDDSIGHAVISLSVPTTPAGLSQLLFVSACVDGYSTMTDLTESDGTATGTRRVADGTGVGSSGEIRDVCVEDPGPRSSQPPLPSVGVMPHVMGTPTPALLPAWTSLDAQTYRSCDALGNITYSSHLTGVPSDPGPSIAVFLLGIPTIAAGATPLFVTSRSASPPAGGPVSEALILPPTLTSLSSAGIEGMWVGIGSAGTLALSYPIAMFL